MKKPLLDDTIFRIYKLVDSNSGWVRYVGVTSFGLDRRLTQHIKEARNTKKKNTHKLNWIRQLLTIGHIPTIVELEQGNKETWSEREKYWIKYYRDLGEPLTNSTDGGEGLWGYSPSEETRTKISIRTKEAMANLPAETKKRIREGRLGKTPNDHTRRRVSETQKGKKKSQESKVKYWNTRRKLGNDKLSTKTKEQKSRRMSRKGWRIERGRRVWFDKIPWRDERIVTLFDLGTPLKNISEQVDLSITAVVVRLKKTGRW